jgi:hypothetical protein
MDPVQSKENPIPALLAEHTRVMNAGFPEKEAQELDKKVAELPTDKQAEYLRLSQVAEGLKAALLPRREA